MEQKFQGFTGETSSFLWDLSFNNERPWFQENRERYQKTLHEPFHALAEDVEREMTQAFPLQNFTVHVSRIYRDARRRPRALQGPPVVHNFQQRQPLFRGAHVLV